MTFMPLKSARFWKVRATPISATWRLFMWLKVLPRKVMLPSCGAYTPLMQLSMLLLPAPLGPMMARTSCSRTLKLMSVSAFTPPKRRLMFLMSRMTSPILRSPSRRSLHGTGYVLASTMGSVALTLPLRPSSNLTAVSMNCSFLPPYSASTSTWYLSLM
jgi:hypothetical protein